MATVFGIVLSVVTAYMAVHFNNIMDMLQLIFAFVNAPLFATFLLGMFWTRATGHGAFAGLLSGTLAAALHHGLSMPIGAESLFKGGVAGPGRACLPERDGAELLDRHLVVEHRLCRHDSRQRGDTPNQERRGAMRPGLQPHHAHG